MKTVERLIVKMIIIQIIFLFIAQALIKYEDRFIHLSKLDQYEGVNHMNYTKIIETFDGVAE